MEFSGTAEVSLTIWGILLGTAAQTLTHARTLALSPVTIPIDESRVRLETCKTTLAKIGNSGGIQEVGRRGRGGAQVSQGRKGRGERT